jgi:diaminopimelate dehydrogenase
MSKKKEKKIKIAIVGYGNVGRGVNLAIQNNKDMELVMVLSRNPDRVKKELKNIPVYDIDDHKKLKKADLAILCGGSKEDLPKQGPEFIKIISTVDSFDNHSKIPEYFEKMNKLAKKSENVSIISSGWDPGTFSIERVLGHSFIPGAKTYGFYGLGEKGGLSMGHSDALRTIEGIKDARQYTHAKLEAIELIRSGKNPSLTSREMHWRECFVVLENGADKDQITKIIISMPGYFEPYDTKVNFVSQEELDSKFKGFPHDGLVIGAGTTGKDNKALIEYKNQWSSNPEATGNILAATARACYKLKKEKRTGAFTLLDIPPAYLSPLSGEELRKNFM